MTNLDFGLPTADELFTTQAERDEAKSAKLHEIEVNKIDQFPKHPYKVRNDADMYNLIFIYILKKIKSLSMKAMIL